MNQIIRENQYLNVQFSNQYLNLMKAKPQLILQLFFLFLYFGATFSQTANILDRPLQEERSRTFNALHYKIELSVDLDTKSFTGKNTISLIPLNSGLDSCSFDLAEMSITGVYHTDLSPLEFYQTDKEVVVKLGRSYSVNDTINLSINYFSHDPSDGLLFDDKTDRWPQMVSSNSWPNHARYWFPCYDHPNDKVTHDVIVTVKNGLKVLSNGKLMRVMENQAESTATWHWRQLKPHSTYLSMLAIGPFVVIEDSLGSLPINYWVYEQDEEVAREVFAISPKAIDFFNKLYDYPYPWAKYDQVIGPHQGGGAEATSATILGLGAVRHKRPDQDDSWERIIAHEAAHQWWGDLITLRSWEHTWMNESFATYSDYLYIRAMKGEDKGALDLEGKKNQYLREAHNRYMRPIVYPKYNSPQDNFDSHTYPKGAIVLHMLRYQLGDETFFRVLSCFLHKHEFQPVDTHDFMKVVKEVTGQNMDWFFDQFIFKPGHPVFEISYNYYSERGSIALKIKQTQDQSIGTPMYKLPVQIGITTTEGKNIQEIWITKKEETFFLPTDTKPLLVRFDEGNYLLKEWTFNKSKKELEFQSKNDDIIGRNWAKKQLDN